MAARLVRLFIPNTEPSENWAETLFGRVIRDLVSQFNDELEWFWFSRHSTNERDDCDISKLPREYRFSIPGYTERIVRSVWFHFSVKDAAQAGFEESLQAKATTHGYCILDPPIDFDWIGGLGGNRYVGKEHRDDSGRSRRALLVTRLYMTLSQLVLDGLVGPDSQHRYRIESNDDSENPNDSSFESMHHFFCNITDVPTSVIVQLGTYWSDSRATELRVKY